jgi:serine/threonine protein kinase/WD40 repeat protein
MAVEETAWQLVEALCSEQRWRWRAGDHLLVEAYLQQHPTLDADANLVLELVYNEVLLREEHGETPGPEEYVRRFPRLADRLQPLFEVHGALEAEHFGSKSTGPMGKNTPGESRGGIGTPVPKAPVEYPAVAGFEILGELGRGAMGVVYRARQINLNRTVALKMIRPDRVPGTDGLQRFRSEAEAAAALDHAHIVPIYEVGEWRAGEGSPAVPYFSMRLIEGGSLDRQIDRFRRQPRAAAQLMATLARAIHFAHQRRILHRDLKPGNILLDEHGQPHVTDFGLAQRLPNPALPATSSNSAPVAEVVGTPSYMAPEQAYPPSSSHEAKADAKAGGACQPTRGGVTTVDWACQPTRAGVTTAADVYSLGAILYELLTGRPPFRGETVQGILEQVRTRSPSPPRILNPAADRDLETICLKCLEKEPGQRYGSAEALAEDLERWLAHEPIRARPVTARERFGLWCRRKPLVALLSAAACLAVATALAASTIGYRSVERLWRDSQQNLRRSLLFEAQALRQSEAPGRRRLALDALKRAAAIQPGTDLRNEYVRCLDLFDIEVIRDFFIPSAAKPGDILNDPVRAGETPPTASFTLGATWLIGKGGLGANANSLRTFGPGCAVEFDPAAAQVRALFPIQSTAKSRTEISPDGRFLVSWTHDQPGARLWDWSAQGKPADLADSNGHALVPRCAVFNDRADLLAMASETQADKHSAIIVYQLNHEAPEIVTRWEVPFKGLDCLRFNPAGTILAASLHKERDGANKPAHEIGLWNLAQKDGQASFLQLDTDGPWVSCRQPRRIDFSPDGKLLVAAGINGAIKQWNVEPVFRREAPALLWTRSLAPQRADHIHFSPDGRWLATSNQQGNLQVWDAQSGNQVAQASPVPSSRPPQPQDLATERINIMTNVDPNADKGLRLWAFVAPLGQTIDLRAFNQPSELPPPFIDALVFSADDRWLACAARNLSAPYLLPLQEPRPVPIALRGTPGQQALAFSSQGDRLWCLSRQGNHRFWDLPSLQSTEEKTALQGITALAVNSKDERIALLNDRGERLKIINLDSPGALHGWDLRQSSLVRGESPSFFKFASTVRLDREGAFAAVMVEQEQKPYVKVLNLVAGSELFAAELPGPGQCVALAAGARRVAAGQGKQILVYEPANGTMLATLVKHETKVTDLSFDRFGTLLASAAEDGTICLWNPHNSEPLLTMPAVQESLWHIALSPSGRWLATGNTHGQVRLWDLEDMHRRLQSAGLDYPSPPIPQE